MSTVISKNNDNVFKIMGTSYAAYEMWCINHRKKAYKKESRECFFKKIHDGTLIPTPNGSLLEDNKLIYKGENLCKN